MRQHIYLFTLVLENAYLNKKWRKFKTNKRENIYKTKKSKTLTNVMQY